MKNNIFCENKWAGYVLAFVGGLLLGGLLLRGCGSHDAGQHDGESEGTLWTCSMDPQVKQSAPGKCPICGMDLIEASQGQVPSSDVDPDAVMLSDEALALAQVETEVVGARTGSKELRLFGKIEPDQRRLQSQSAYVAGRIERLLVSAEGDRVAKGQTLAVIYSPELYTAEQELLAALRFADEAQRPAVVEAAQERLRLLNVPQRQIDDIVASGKASPYVELKANTAGTVVRRQVAQGDYVGQGEPLMQIADLSRVWAVLQAYETDLPLLSKGQTVVLEAEALPGETFSGRVSFVEPVLNAQTRTVGVRIELTNPGGRFKPEMLLVGHVAASMQQYADEGVVVPKSAVLWTGRRSVVYVKDDAQEQPTFLLRQVTLGPALPDAYVVIDGLAEGEEIVTHGVFAIDAAAQLDGKRSMISDNE